jgi:hypothetical protein
MKGQKSLQMIIGMVMLLVVAGVTISMFLNVFQEPDLGENTQERQEIQNQCAERCNSWKEASGDNSLSAALEYCTAKFERDVDGDGSTTDIAGSGYNSYCQDGIHCFNEYSCEQGVNEVLNAQKCRQIMCEYYTTSGGTPYNEAENPGNNVHDRIRTIMSPENEETGVGQCGLPTATDSADYKISTWYNPANQDYSLVGGDGENNDPTTGLVCPPEYSNQGGTSGGGGGDEGEEGPEGPPPESPF